MPVFRGYMKVSQEDNTVVAKNGAWLQGVKVQGDKVWLPSAEKTHSKGTDDIEFLQNNGTGPTISVEEARQYARSILDIIGEE